MTCTHVVFSSLAYLSIVAETYAHLQTETGGILLGVRQGSTWYVLDVIDPGYHQVSRTPGYFEYDTEYVNHLANIRARLYAAEIELLGLWHRHPGSFDRFSGMDDQTHQRYIQQNKYGAISILVNLDPDIRLSLYYVSTAQSGIISGFSPSSLNYQRLSNWMIGDTHIPLDLKQLPPIERFTRSRQQTVSGQSRSTIWGSAKKIWSEITTSTSNQRTATDADVHRKSSIEENERQTLALDMLEEELAAFLEKQTEYEYQIQLDDEVVEISLAYQGSMPYYPKRTHCQFFVRNGTKLCRLDDHVEQLYQPGIIQRHINKLVEAAIHQSEQSERKAQYQQDYTPAVPPAQAVNNQTMPNATSIQEPPFIKKIREEFQLPIDFTATELKDAYRRLIKDVHPDTWQHEQNSTLTANANQATSRINQSFRALKGYLDDRQRNA